jgi:hypothetical protein
MPAGKNSAIRSRTNFQPQFRLLEQASHFSRARALRASLLQPRRILKKNLVIPMFIARGLFQVRNIQRFFFCGNESALESRALNSDTPAPSLSGLSERISAPFKSLA